MLRAENERCRAARLRALDVVAVDDAGIQAVTVNPDAQVAPEVAPEGLVTNGLGGYACGTMSGLVTRRFHGYLIAALAARW